MMTEIIPKESPKTSTLLVVLFYSSLVLLVVLTIVYFRINGSIKKNQEVLAGLENDLLKLQSAENLSLKKEILDYDKRINNFKDLAADHRFNSRVFKFLEDFIHPRVWFESFEFQSDDAKVMLSGRSKTFEALGQQIMIFQQEKQIKDLVLEGIAIGKEGDIEFNFSFLFDPQFLQ